MRSSNLKRYAIYGAAALGGYWLYKRHFTGHVGDAAKAGDTVLVPAANLPGVPAGLAGVGYLAVQLTTAPIFGSNFTGNLVGVAATPSALVLSGTPLGVAGNYPVQFDKSQIVSVYRNGQLVSG